MASGAWEELVVFGGERLGGLLNERGTPEYFVLS